MCTCNSYICMLAPPFLLFTRPPHTLELSVLWKPPSPPCGLGGCFLPPLVSLFFCGTALDPVSWPVFSSVLRLPYFLSLSSSGICGFPSL